MCESKVIHLSFGNDAGRDAYVKRLKEVCAELQSIAGEFNATQREILADLTYVVVGDDIMSTIQGIEKT